MDSKVGNRTVDSMCDEKTKCDPFNGVMGYGRLEIPILFASVASAVFAAV
jgi:hypothetical protein